MSDLAQLENEILADIAAAADEAALEAVRVAALGKNGTVTALLKTLGTLAPEQRKSFARLEHVHIATRRAARGCRRAAPVGAG